VVAVLASGAILQVTPRPAAWCHDLEKVLEAVEAQNVRFNPQSREVSTGEVLEKRKSLK
jgi:hypothetical protein